MAGVHIGRRRGKSQRERPETGIRQGPETLYGVSAGDAQGGKPSFPPFPFPYGQRLLYSPASGERKEESGTGMLRRTAFHEAFFGEKPLLRKAPALRRAGGTGLFPVQDTKTRPARNTGRGAPHSCAALTCSCRNGTADSSGYAAVHAPCGCWARRGIPRRGP